MVTVAGVELFNKRELFFKKLFRTKVILPGGEQQRMALVRAILK